MEEGTWSEYFAYQWGRLKSNLRGIKPPQIKQSIKSGPNSINIQTKTSTVPYTLSSLGSMPLYILIDEPNARVIQVTDYQFIPQLKLGRNNWKCVDITSPGILWDFEGSTEKWVTADTLKEALEALSKSILHYTLQDKIR